MSGSGSPATRVQAEGVQVAIIAASWHQQVMEGLISGAARACGEAGAVGTVFRVPGSFELPIVAAACARSGQFEAIVALGVVIRGGTPHFEYVCQAATDGLGRVALDHGVPVGFGLLTCDTEQQALDRSGLPGSSEDKGAEATFAALMAALTLRDVAESTSAPTMPT
jgi:6,7-dimethyl-8-ribityllumazine synthase